MADLKPIGSEKLPLDSKIRRIVELANYGNKQDVSENSYQTIVYDKKASDGNVYAIIQENSNYIIKKGKDTNSLDYLNGIKNSKKNTFSSYSRALKKLNLMFKPLNEEFNGGNENPLIGEQKKFVLKTPEPAGGEEDMDLDMDVDMDGGEEDMDLDMDVDMEGGDEDMDLDMEGGDEEMDVEMDVEGKSSQDPTKTIQKLTGKLGQKLRDFADDLDADMIKYVINSIISAVDVTELTAEDVEDIVEKLESDEDIEYSEEGEFDVELDGEEELDLDMGGDEDLDLDLDMGDEEEIELAETGRGRKDMGEMWGKLAQLAAVAAGERVGSHVSDKYLEEDLEEGFDFEDEDDFEELDQQDVETVNAEIQNIFAESRPAIINNSLKKYFKYTKSELRESKNAKKIKNTLKKDFIKSKIVESNKKRKLQKAFKSYEQERLSKSFLKENRGFNYIGQNKRGDIVLQQNDRVVQITPKGKFIK
tara:strand:- start:7551 stop:8978 length:1428 start_codon:yes stop_codon:yes gene_type:complete